MFGAGRAIQNRVRRHLRWARCSQGSIGTGGPPPSHGRSVYMGRAPVIVLASWRGLCLAFGNFQAINAVVGSAHMQKIVCVSGVSTEPRRSIDRLPRRTSTASSALRSIKSKASSNTAMALRAFGGDWKAQRRVECTLSIKPIKEGTETNNKNTRSDLQQKKQSGWGDRSLCGVGCAWQNGSQQNLNDFECQRSHPARARKWLEADPLSDI